MTTSITAIVLSDANAKALRAVNKFGMNLFDFAALTTTASFSGLGNGTGYTVTDWISDGVFANLAAVQAVYPIVQSGSDTVDWVLLQSAIDFLIYGSLGTSNRKNTKRRLFIPAGVYVCNHPLQIGYARVGTPPANLNGNGYVSITLEGEGVHYDSSGNGMTGTTISFPYTNDLGIAINLGVQIFIKGMTILGNYTYLASNNGIINLASGWDVSTYKDPALPAANWLSGSAVNIGIALDPYSAAGSAAAYPARILPSYFGGGTTTAQFSTAGGSDCTLEDVNISKFVIGYGRPHGDSNGEFIRHIRGSYSGCVYPIVIAHSQCRSVAFRDLNMTYFHSAFTNKGGTQGNSNMHGIYENIHASYGYQMFSYNAGGWTGPIKLNSFYAEGVYKVGDFNSNPVTIDNCYFNFYDATGVGSSPRYHVEAGKVKIENSTFYTRNGVFVSCIADINSLVLSNNSVIASTLGATLSGNSLPAYAFMNGFFGTAGPRSREIEGNVFYYTDPTNVQFAGGAGYTDAGVPHVSQKTETYAVATVDGTTTYGAVALMGGSYTYPVPVIQHKVIGLGTCASRTGYDVVFTRYSFGTLKADVGDVFMISISGSVVDYYFVCVSIAGGNMTLRQMNGYFSANAADYQTDGTTQVTAGVSYTARYICTRVRSNPYLVLGSVTSGSAVISNVKAGLNNANAISTTELTMAAGDYFIHPEEDILNVGGSPTSPLNLVSAVNTAAQTITLTNTFKHTDACYPVVFYVKVYNA